MKKNKASITLIMLCLLAALGGLLWAANIMGVINLKELAGNLSYQKILMKQPPGNEPNIPAISPIEKENQELRVAAKALEEKIATLEGEKTSLLKQIEEIQQELVSLRAYKREKENFF